MTVDVTARAEVHVGCRIDKRRLRAEVPARVGLFELLQLLAVPVDGHPRLEPAAPVEGDEVGLVGWSRQRKHVRERVMVIWGFSICCQPSSMTRTSAVGPLRLVVSDHLASDPVVGSITPFKGFW